MKVYLPNLNGLRFLACMVVVVTHTEMIKWVYGMENYYTEGLKRLGHLAVISFFVLSGFLITYLLMVEKDKKKTVSIKNFYMRRILRIWPLYFFTVLLGLFVWPQISFFNVPGQPSIHSVSYWSIILLYLFILPNVAVKAFVPSPVPLLSPSWSIGVEEQFYFMWPWLVKFAKNILFALFGVIIFYNIVLFILSYLSRGMPDTTPLKIASNVWENFTISTMAVGGLMAWVKYHQKEKILKLLFHPIVDIGTYVLFLGLVIKGVRFPIFHPEIYAFLFAIMILNLSSNPNSFVNMENRFFNYMGKISYGFYMFHILSIFVVFKLMKPLFDGLPHQVVSLIVIAISAIFVTVISSLTFHYLEEPLLKLKSKFSTIITGDMAKSKSKK
ncbi:MAG: acyltransferase [Chitinophagales bacterium]|nr:acyltransferase [Chitinophagales bacterium]